MFDTFKDICDLTINRINEDFGDEQIDAIIQNAINHSYIYDVSSKDPNVVVTYVPVINGVATLPDDIDRIVSISPELQHNEKRIGRSILSQRDVTFTITYASFPEPMVNETDAPQVSSKYRYLMSTYACYTYFTFKKKTDVANMFMSEYQSQLNKIEDTENTGEEVVYDVGGISYGEN